MSRIIMISVRADDHETLLAIATFLVENPDKIIDVKDVDVQEDSTEDKAAADQKIMIFCHDFPGFSMRHAVERAGRIQLISGPVLAVDDALRIGELVRSIRSEMFPVPREVVIPDSFQEMTRLNKFHGVRKFPIPAQCSNRRAGWAPGFKRK